MRHEKRWKDTVLEVVLVRIPRHLVLQLLAKRHRHCAVALLALLDGDAHLGQEILEELSSRLLPHGEARRHVPAHTHGVRVSVIK